MAKSLFGGGAYALRSLPLAAQTCINLFMEPREDAQGEYAFYGTPGTEVRATLDGTGHRASIKAGGYLWAVVANKVFKVDSAYTATLIGTITNSTGKVRMAANTTQVGIAHPSGWHVIDLDTEVMAAVSGAPTMSDITFIDNYGVGAQSDGTYCWTALADFSDIDALNFASAEGNPDDILRTLADHRELWLFGEETIEVAVVTDDADLPFTRTAFIEQGILAPSSAAKEDNSVFWLGRNEKGQGVIYRAQGYVPSRISTFAIEQAIAGYASPEDATAYTYQQDGHHFYVLNFAEATWVYDLNTGLWHQRAYRNLNSGALERHRGETHAFFNGEHLIGDYQDGRLYALDLDLFTDDEDPIYRERTWAQIESENHWIRFDRGELIAEMGVGLDASPGVGEDPSVYLRWSDDGGRTWGNDHDRSIGRLGAYRNRAIWRRMGRSRSRYYRLWTTEPVRIAWRAFNFDMDVANK